jgi:hypothetical protein
MSPESISRRVIAGLAFHDVNSDLTLRRRLLVTAELAPPDPAAGRIRIGRSRGNIYTIDPPRGWTGYLEAFTAPPAEPAPGSRQLRISVSDPLGRYLPRRHLLDVPRDPDPANNDQPDSLFKPARIDLYPSPVATIAPGWAVVRVTVSRNPGGERAGAALIRVLDAADSDVVLGRSLTEWRGRVAGEAMVTIPGIPVTTWGNGDSNGGGGPPPRPNDPVIVNTVSATVEAYFDPALVLGEADLPDPDDLEERRASLLQASAKVELVSGETITLALTIPAA